MGNGHAAAGAAAAQKVDKKWRVNLPEILTLAPHHVGLAGTNISASFGARDTPALRPTR